MKLHIFRARYMNYVRYYADRQMLDKYNDVDLLVYVACGAKYTDNRKQYSTALVFKSSRKMMAFLNGARCDVLVAYTFIKNAEKVVDANKLDEVERFAFAEAL